MDNIEMHVVKRDGKIVPVLFDKILNRIKNLGIYDNRFSYKLSVNYTTLVIKVVDQLYNGIKTSEIDELLAQQCSALAAEHYDHFILAGRILISNHQKNTEEKYIEIVHKLYCFTDVHNKHSPLVSRKFFDTVDKYQDEIQKMLDYNRDFLIDHFGWKTLERAYLMRTNGKILERPQHMWMRVAIGIHGDNMEKVKKTYDLMSTKYFTHATPTLFNAGTPRPQCSSCYLLAMEDDSIGGIYKTLSDCAEISKWAGGIGLHIHNVRGRGSHIRGTNGTSNGIVPMLKVFNGTARYVDQCILPETYIYTTQGPKQIQYCTNDDIIFNNKNKEKIQNILEHPYQGNLLSIETMHSIEPLKITEEHPIFVLKEQKGANYKVIKNRLNKKLIKPEWGDAKNLTNKDFIIFNIPKYEKNIEYIDEEDCYVYGVILGDGCFSNSDTTGYISLHKTTKKHILDTLINYFNKKCIRYNITTENNTTRIRWLKNTILPFKYSEIYDINKEKIFHSRWLNLPLKKAKYILKGLIDTDGCKHIELTFDTTSRNLIESMKYLFLRMGILTSGYIRDRRGETHISKYGCSITNKKISYCLRIPKTKEISELVNIKQGQFFKFFRYDTFLFSRIKSISKTTYSGTLYDLQMGKNHNYMVHNGIIHNGGGRRNGSFAIYLEPWHADIESFLDLKKNHGDEEQRARDLFYALWIPDLFMKRVEADKDWTLLCPDQCPGLSDCYGEEFEKLYEQYETTGPIKKTIKARDLWFKILDSQMETGTPYMLYKDACNKKSNQQNLGTIKSSNLCSEILEYSDENQTAVCNLASIALSMYVNEDKTYNYEKLHEVVKIVTENLNIVIDINFYPTEKTRLSNFLHRPIGIGVQGLADAFAKMDIPFHSEKAKEINIKIFETIYHAALEKSYEISKERCSKILELKKMQSQWKFMDSGEDCNEYIFDGPKKNHKKISDFLNEMRPIKAEIKNLKDNLSGAYSSFVGSPASIGTLQFDFWGVKPSGYDWDELKKKIKEYGLRNSLLVALMPTASTSQILGNNECFEPFTSTIYVRRTLAGEFVCVNKYLQKELMDLGLWSTEIKNSIIKNQGSIQHLTNIPEHIRNKYKIVWEIPMKNILEMSRDRGAFICHTQSLNLWTANPNYKLLTAIHFFGWNAGLKTGLYYLRSRAKAAPQQFTIEPSKKNFECLSCGS